MSPADHFSPTVSWVVEAVLVLGPLAALLGALLRRARNALLARGARRAMGDATAEELGETCVVAGTVEYAGGASLAARVEIDQEGTEQEGSGSWSHRWTEVSRRLEVAPFYVVRPNGSRIRVEPTELAQLVDDLDGKVLVRRDKRIVSAELTPGETIWVVGSYVLGPDPENTTHYRGGTSRVLRPPPRGPMLLSSKPLDHRYRGRARLHRTFAVVHALLFLVCAWFAWPFLDRARGATSRGIVTASTERTDEDGDIKGWRVTVSAGGRTEENLLEENVSVGADVPVRAGRFSLQIGERATLSYHVVWLLAALGLVIAVYRFSAKESLPWYRRKVVDTGSGRLDETEEKAQIAARVAKDEAEAAKSPEALRAASARARAERARKNAEAKERARKERLERKR